MNDSEEKAIRAKIETRLNNPSGPLPVGQLIDKLDQAGKATRAYEHRRSTEDRAAHNRWDAARGVTANTCSYCHGSGELDDSEMDDHSGDVHYKTIQCHICGGSGRVR